MAQKDFDYKKSKQELDDILDWFEAGEVDIDKAIAKYQKAEELLEDLSKYLSDASAKIEKLVKNK